VPSKELPASWIPSSGKRDTLSPVDEGYTESAERVRSLIERGQQDPSLFRAALLRVAPTERDAWLNLVLGLGELPDDGPDLPTASHTLWPMQNGQSATS